MNENLTLKEIVINDQNYQILNVQLQNGVSYLRLQANTGKEERINMTYLIQNLYEQKVEEDMRLGRFQNLEDMRQKISNVHEYLKDHVMYQSLMRLDSNIRLDDSILNQSLQKLLKEYQQKNQENKVQMNGLSNQTFENQGNKEEVMVNESSNTILDNKVGDSLADQMIQASSVNQSSESLYQDLTSQKKEIPLYSLNEIDKTKLTVEQIRTLEEMMRYAKNEGVELLTDYSLNVFRVKGTDNLVKPVMKDGKVQIETFAKEENTKTTDQQTVSKNPNFNMVSPEEQRLIQSMSTPELERYLQMVAKETSAKHQALYLFIYEELKKRKEKQVNKDLGKEETLEKNKVLQKTMNSTNLGYTNTFLLTFLTGIVGGILLVILKHL